MADKGSGSIDIQAPPADVMAVIAAIPDYPKWAGAVSTADVLESFPDGRPKRVHFEVSFMGISDSYENVYTWSGDDEVRWTLAEGKSMSAQDGLYRLTARDGGTHVEYELEVELKVKLPGLIRRRAQSAVIDSALKDLKKVVESQTS